MNRKCSLRVHTRGVSELWSNTLARTRGRSEGRKPALLWELEEPQFVVSLLQHLQWANDDMDLRSVTTKPTRG